VALYAVWPRVKTREVVVQHERMTGHAAIEPADSLGRCVRPQVTREPFVQDRVRRGLVCA
jgi:hypothetical protein